MACGSNLPAGLRGGPQLRDAQRRLKPDPRRPLVCAVVRLPQQHRAWHAGAGSRSCRRRNAAQPRCAAPSRLKCFCASVLLQRFLSLASFSRPLRICPSDFSQHHFRLLNLLGMQITDWEDEFCASKPEFCSANAGKKYPRAVRARFRRPILLPAVLHCLTAPAQPEAPNECSPLARKVQVAVQDASGRDCVTGDLQWGVSACARL